MIIIGVEIMKLKRHLSDEFELKDIDELRYFMGIEFVRSKENLVMY